MHHIERITCSNDSLVISGVPQGIVLAPLLFILLIADRSSKIIAFADDKRVYCYISTMADSDLLQYVNG